MKKRPLRSAHHQTLSAKRKSGASGPHRKGSDKRARKYNHAWRSGQLD